jgi:hypothetical protein
MTRADYKIEGAGKIVIQNKDNRFKEIDTTPKEPYFSFSGNPVQADLEIESTTYTGADLRQYTTPRLELKGALIDITQTKNIVSTPIAGRDGTVKEYIAMGDYVINIAVTLNAPNGEKPDKLMAELMSIKTAPVALKVNSWFLTLYNIYYLVITDFKLGQEAGKYSSQTVTISALSDSTFIIE